MAARWPHHSWYHLLFVSSSLTREKSILSYHHLLSLCLSFPLPLSEGLMLPCKQEERREQPCVPCEWTPVTSSPFSSFQLQDQGHLAVGREETERHNPFQDLTHPESSHTYNLFSSCSLCWHGTLWSGRNHEVKPRANPKPQPLTGKE